MGVVQGVLPVFLEGMVNPSDEIKSICIVSILKITHKAVSTYMYTYMCMCMYMCTYMHTYMCTYMCMCTRDHRMGIVLAYQYFGMFKVTKYTLIVASGCVAEASCG